MQRALGTIYEDIMDFHIEAVKLFAKSSRFSSHTTIHMLILPQAWRNLFQATSRSLNNKISLLSKCLRRHTGLLDRQASLIEYKEAQSFRLEMKATFEQQEHFSKCERRSRVLQWLGSISADARHHDINEARYTGTGQWLIDDLNFQKWFSPDQCIDPLLWLHGMPGAGQRLLLPIATVR